MKRLPAWFLPLMVALLTLGLTAWLAQHERETQHRTLRSNFDFGVRQAASRIEQRMASFDQMLRGLRGLFEASDDVDQASFTTYVDTLLAGPDAAGLRSLAYAPLLTGPRIAEHVAHQVESGLQTFRISPPGQRDPVAPLTLIAPSPPPGVPMLGFDPLSEPVRREALLKSADAGIVSITHRITNGPAAVIDNSPAFLMALPVYSAGPSPDTVAARRARVRGWVMANFRIGDLMSSLYGEGTPGLELCIYDGLDLSPGAVIYDANGSAVQPPRTPRFETQEYLAVGGRTWTLQVRSTPGFERQFSNDSARIILIAGGVLSVLLALITWLMATARERAHAVALQMTRALRESAEGYRRIVETANEGIWTLDAAGRTTFANPKLQQMLGYSAQELRGRHWAELLEGTPPLALQATSPSQPGAGQQPPKELCLRRKDGSPVWVHLSTSEILDAAGQPAGALAMVTDVSERHEAEQRRLQLEAQLRQSQKMEAIGTLAGGIAHDFNNILAAILGNVSLVREHLPEAADAQGRLQQIGQAGERARSLVQQIVAFSRQQPQARVNQPLRPLLEETVKLLRSTLPALVELELRVPEQPLRIQADATQLQQVLMNLCTNAWHALQGRAGRIVIGMEEQGLDRETAERLGLAEGRFAHLWVSDNGSGMSEATRQRVFEPFFTTKPVGQGTGLGLSVVHGIVTSHGGAITVKSRRGHGSCFDLYFPVAETPAEAPAPATAEAVAPPQGRGEHVLYVDDDPVMLLMVEGLLQRAGYQVTCLDDPRHALELVLADEAPFDAMVTDHNMPELSGIELAQRVTQARPQLPVVITSGFVSERMRAEAHRAGVRHVLQKEYTLEQLAGLVHSALEAVRRPSEPVDGAPA